MEGWASAPGPAPAVHSMRGTNVPIASASHRRMTLPRIHIGRPQRLAALLLLAFLAQCLWVVGHQQLSTEAFTIHGDGIFAYRVVELPLALLRLAHGDDSRLSLFVLHLPFVFFALLLGGGLWWVTRRLYGNEGGFFALGLYCFCPAVVRMAVAPNNDLLAMWGLYGLIYTAIGVAHAMQGPRRRWRPRIVLLTVAIGFTAAAHLLAAIFGFIAALVFMLYLAERRRGYVFQVLLIAAIGALAILFAFYGFRPAVFRHVFTGGAARFWFSLAGIHSFVFDRGFAGSLANLPILIAACVAALLYCAVRRSRYFGNTTPLLVLLALAPLIATQTVSAPWLWALPFFFTFIGGVFADALETRTRKLFLVLTGAVLAAQAMACLAALPLIARC